MVVDVVIVVVFALFKKVLEEVEELTVEPSLLPELPSSSSSSILW